MPLYSSRGRSWEEGLFQKWKQMNLVGNGVAGQTLSWHFKNSSLESLFADEGVTGVPGISGVFSFLKNEKKTTTYCFKSL